MMVNEPNEISAMGGKDNSVINETIAALRKKDGAANRQFEMRALEAFDSFTRARKNRLSLDVFADAFGLRVLSRPLAAAGLLLSVGFAGVAAGVMTPESDNAVYAELSVAFDEVYDFSEEVTP